jgi:hypothetical protein
MIRGSGNRPGYRRRRAAALALAPLILAGCPPKKPKTGPPPFNADLKSGPDGKRSGAQVLRPNKPKTDEVSYPGQDKTDWYVIALKGQPNVLTTEIHWDTDGSDIMIDVFDEFGAQIAASPVRAKGAKSKKLLTQIDKPGTYYIRVTAPTKADGSVYTMEAKWDAPADLPTVVEADPLPPPQPPPPPRRPHREHVERPDPPEKASGDTIQGHVVSAYREGASLTLHIDKGASAGVKVGMSGTILSGPSGEDPLQGGSFKVVQVLDGNKSLAHSSLQSIGKNTRVMITLSR